MVRELIEIEASEDGWRVCFGGSHVACATKLQAIEEAHALASRRFVETGRPTAVRVPVGNADAVIVGCCG